MPRIRSLPEDFVVTEIPLFEPLGEGEHLYLWVEKRLATTEEVAGALAAAAGARRREVGYAGRKDRQAVTRQWFSVPLPAASTKLDLDLPGVRILDARRHRHKLRAGDLRGNRFEIVVREIDSATSKRALERLGECAERGFPNRFGRQRFGRDGTNAERGREVLLGGRRLRDRRAARFLVSALQSAIFNQVLARREVPVHSLRTGDVAYVHASGGLFLVEEAAGEAERAARFEISPTGPIFGSKMRQPTGETREEELEALSHFDLEEEAFQRWRWLRGGRRPLRVPVREGEGEIFEGGLRLRFTLAPGSYATVLLDEILCGLPLLEGEPVSSPPSERPG